MGHQLVLVAGAPWGSWLLGDRFECDLMLSMPLIKQPLLRCCATRAWLRGEWQ